MSSQANVPTPTRSEIEDVIIAKAQADLEFRQSLLKNANAAIEKEFGVAMPKDLKIIAVEETATTHYLLLPPIGDGELSEADLAAVAGGISGIGEFMQMRLQTYLNMYSKQAAMVSNVVAKTGSASAGIAQNLK